MVSKYDEFWRTRADDVRPLIVSAAAGRVGSADFSAIRPLGERASWAGSASVRDLTVISSSMAHMTSLANAIVAGGLCASWPETTFVFSMNAGGTLTVRQLGAPLSRHLGPRVAQRAPGRPALADAGTVPTDPTEACQQIHAMLARLPRYADPKQVPFSNGLYFFFESGEDSDHGHPRITRIGNHPHAQGRLAGRLWDHYTTKRDQKNWSVFRRYLGGALLRRDGVMDCLEPSPGRGHWESGKGLECDACAPYEARVTERLQQGFTFTCVEIELQDLRNELERRLIAAVAQCRTCRPSASWLGSDAYPSEVRSSGLWNSQHVEGTAPSSELLDEFSHRVASSRAGATDLSDTLLLIPCSAGKRGRDDLGLVPTSISSFLGESANAVLLEGRARAFERAPLDCSSPRLPALARYSGQPYKTPGFLEAVLDAMTRGLHVVIVSGGYGLVRAEEPIQDYEAPMTKMLTVWRRRIPTVLRDYVERNGIHRTFGAFSTAYAAVVPDQLGAEDWRAVPTLDDVGGGPAMVRIPQRVASLTLELLATDFAPGPHWMRSS